MEIKFSHICEVCQTEAYLSSEEAFGEGWDYPPYMGLPGVISPRTCPECAMQDTVWFALAALKTEVEDLTDAQLKTIDRIVSELEDPDMVQAQHEFESKAIQ